MPRVALVALVLLVAAPLAAQPVTLWSHPFPDGFVCSPAVADLDRDGHPEIVVVTMGGLLSAVRADGTVAWSAQLEPREENLSSPSVADLDGDGTPEILIGSQNGLLYCFGPDGKLRWSAPTPEPIRRSAAVPVDLDGDGRLEIVATGRSNGIFALDSQGKLRWNFPTGGGTGAPPLALDADGDGRPEVFASCYDGHLYCLDADGKLRWKYATNNEVYSGPVAVDLEDDGRPEIFFGGRDQNLYCLDAASGRLRWLLNTGEVVDTGISLARSGGGVQIFCGNEGGSLVALDQTGRLRWRIALGSAVHSAPVIADLNGDGALELVVGGWDGGLFIVRAEDGSILWQDRDAPVMSGSAALADLDGDGQIEIVTADRSGRLALRRWPREEAARSHPLNLVWPVRRLDAEMSASLIPAERRPPAALPQVEVALESVSPAAPATGPLQLTVVYPRHPAPDEPVRITVAAAADERHPGAKVRLTVSQQERDIQLDVLATTKRVNLASGANVTTFGIWPVELAPGQYLVRLEVFDNAMSSLAAQTLRLVKASETVVGEKVAEARKRLASLQLLLAQAKGRGLDTSYPTVSATVVENFAQYALDDVSRGLVLRADHVADVILDSAAAATAETRALLDDPAAAPAVPPFAADRVRIAGGAYRVEDRPVFLIGGMGWDQPINDIPKLHNYGLNIIGLEMGPSATLDSETQVKPDWADELAAIFESARGHNIAITFLLSPHYFPQWAYQKYPEVRTCGSGFMQFCILNPNARRVIEAHLRAIIPVLRRQPMLDSYILANEPTFDERCDHARAFFHRWLRARYPDIAAVNAAWGTSYPSFDAVPWDKSLILDQPAYRYDVLRAHFDMGTDYFAFMARVIRELDPRTPIHIKFMAGAFSPGEETDGIDREALGQLTDVSGCDAVVGIGEKEYALGFPGQVMFYDLLRSFQPGKPIFNSEDHIIRDNDPRHYPARHMTAAYWEAALHGLGASTIWLWDRAEGDSSTRRNVLTRPECVEAMGRAALDLNRLSPPVTALAAAPSPIAFLFSLSSKIQSVDSPYLNQVIRAYEGGYFGGAYGRFISEDQILAGRLDAIKLLVAPGVTHLPSDVYSRLVEWVSRGGVVVATKGAFAFDEHGRPREAADLLGLRRGAPNPLGAEGLPIVPSGDFLPRPLQARDRLERLDPVPEPGLEVLALTAGAPILVHRPLGRGHVYYVGAGLDAKDYAALLAAVARQHDVALQPQALDAAGQPIWGIEARAVNHEGQPLVYLLNHTREPKDVTLPPSFAGSARDLISRRGITWPLRLEPLQPVLISPQ